MKFLAKKEDEENTYKYYLNDPIEDETMKELETVLGCIPTDFRTFLLSHDGGFICSGIMAEYIREADDMEAINEVRKDSINLLKAAEVIEKKQFAERICKNIRGLDIQPERAFIFVRSEHKYAAMQAKKDSSVFSFARYSLFWYVTEIYPNFRSFLYDYVKNDGYIDGL